MLIHRYDSPDRFVTGTVGPPGDRTFFLQAKEGTRLTSVTLEKEQVAVLAERLLQLLAGVESGPSSRRRIVLSEAVTAGVEIDIADSDPLDQPIEEEFRVGTMTLAWDEASKTVIVEAFAATETEDEEATEALVVKISSTMAQQFTQRAQAVVSAGRPACQFCGNPIDPEGHLCPRANGFKRLTSG